MPFKFVPVVAYIFILAFFSSMPTIAKADMVQPIWVDGQNYEARLERNHRLEATDAEHYEGYFPEDPDSWVRVSRLDSGWEGMAYAFGSMHIIGGGEKPVTFSFSQIDEPPKCGVDHPDGQSLITPDSLNGPAMTKIVSADYGELCDNKIDGVCLMLKLELAFDKQFQVRFEKPKEQAGAILNIVEGFYKDQFGIVFDTLSLTFLNSAQDKLLSTTTKADQLLDNVTKKRLAGGISFLQSKYSVFHLVSGWDFDGSTAGVAWTSTLGRGDGYTTGVSNASNNAAATALIVAHEIGHNLGAGHDGQDGAGKACNSGFIMGPWVNANASRFSSCSENSITGRISSINTVEQCFNFPADISLSASSGNPSEVEQGASFQANFQVNYQDATIKKADGIIVDGVIGEGEGRFVGVSLDGHTCTLTGSVDSSGGFNCPRVEARTGLTLSIQAEAGTSTAFNLLQNATLVSDSGEVKDILLQNNELLTQVMLSAPKPVTPEEPATPEKPGNDASQPTTPSVPKNSSSGSGGGGAVNWMWLLLGVFAVACRRKLFK